MSYFLALGTLSPSPFSLLPPSLPSALPLSPLCFCLVGAPPPSSPPPTFSSLGGSTTALAGSAPVAARRLWWRAPCGGGHGREATMAGRRRTLAALAWQAASFPAHLLVPPPPPDPGGGGRGGPWRVASTSAARAVTSSLPLFALAAPASSLSARGGPCLALAARGPDPPRGHAAAAGSAPRGRALHRAQWPRVWRRSGAPPRARPP